MLLRQRAGVSSGECRRSTNGSTITYTPPATVTAAFSTTFTYIARDSIGALSTPGTVTVQVSPRPPQETFAVTAATVTARSNNRYNWDFSGTSSVTTGNTVTVRVTTTTGVQTLGTATVALTGRWRLADVPGRTGPLAAAGLSAGQPARIRPLLAGQAQRRTRRCPGHARRSRRWRSAAAWPVETS